ncbi:serine hydrolase domain-containing protein [Cellulomonas composti]|uniref:Beta-lactamase-related domain-containing protein n=1 Tax=Cellulomonas composti TaxID=266130 RepID=A0A511J7B9_9CELL|nr:serine hydrolase [Cellulomonas composti]GEL93897.1 hypothetical protein CCO02nite_05550 [Cellulomonas composti]
MALDLDDRTPDLSRASDVGARRLPRSTPEQQGVDPGGVARLVRALASEAPELHSLMLVRHGFVVAEAWAAPFSSDRTHLLYSLSKTFTASAVGFARAEGLLDLDDLLVELLARLTPGHVSDEALGGLDAGARALLGRLRVRDLLTMTSGHDADPSEAVFAGEDWLAGFLAQPLAHEPGTHFVYNTAATYVLAELVQRAAGVGLVEYLRLRLYEPLGIVGVTWELSPTGYEVGGFGMSATTEDLAVLGELFLRDGVWAGRQVLPEGWAALASAAQVPSGWGGPAEDDSDSDWSQGYGFQMWRSRHGGYRGDGAFGQYCLVLPEQDAVVAITASVPDMGAQLAIVWEHLLPAFAPDELPDDPAGRAALAAAVDGLRLDPPQGPASSAVGDAAAGRRVAFAANPAGLRSVVLRPGVTDELELTFDEGVVALVAGHGEAVNQPVPMPAHGNAPVLQADPVHGRTGIGWQDAAVSAIWPEPDLYRITVRLLGMPHTLTIDARWSGSSVTVTGGFDLWMGDGRLPTLIGTIEG